MDYLEKVKVWVVAFLTALTAALGLLAVPVYILVGANIIDYTTGIYAAICRGEPIISNVGFRGICKKICMWLLVIVGFALDYIFLMVADPLGIDMGIKNIVALAVVFWLLANEIISILENISDIGTPLPPFLMVLVKLLKQKTEDTVATTTKNNR